MSPLLLFILALAGHALAQSTFNFTFGDETLTSREILAFPPGPYLESDTCQPQCTMANMSITSCGPTDSQCLCQVGVATALEQCEQCLFNFLIAQNIPAPDPRIGASTILSGYTGACTTNEQPVNTTLALTLPDDWAGPVSEVFNTPATIVVVGIGALLGVFCLYTLSNIE